LAGVLGNALFWWFFWVALMVMIFTPITPVSISRRRETALEVLQRRYASGSITTVEYEERKAKPEHDTK